MRVLIAYGSKRGGTAGLAAMIGTGFEAHGITADVRPAHDTASAAGYDAIVIGGALYMNRWHKDARRLARRFGRSRVDVPVWLFSSGPLDDSATERDIPPVRQVVKASTQCGARGHVTFGGRLLPDAKGFPARAMAKNLAGDWRNPAHVERWVRDVVSHLDRAHPQSGVRAQESAMPLPASPWQASGV